MYQITDRSLQARKMSGWYCCVGKAGETFALFVDRLNIDWDMIEKILEAFLWLDRACSPGGRDLWAKVETMSL